VPSKVNEEADDEEGDSEQEDVEQAPLSPGIDIQLRKLRNFINAKRTLEVYNEDAGIWAKLAEKESESRVLFSQRTNRSVKFLQFFAFIAFLILVLQLDFEPSTCRTTFLYKYSKNIMVLYFICNWISYIFLALVVIVMSYFCKIWVRMAVLVGFLNFFY